MRLLKLCFSVFTVWGVHSFVPPSSMLPATSVVHDILNIGVPLIVPAHGSVDVFHALQENKTRHYFTSNVLAYVTYPLINYVSPETAIIVFLSLSAYHFRHQFEFVGKNMSIIPASAFVYFGYHNPDILYLFLAFVHTPHQYWKFREFVLHDKELSTLVVTLLTGMGMCISYNDWSSNVFITSTLVAHILYQECIRFI